MRSRVRRAPSASSAASAASTQGVGSGYGAMIRRSRPITAGVGQQAADTRAGQRPGLGQRSQHAQVGMLAQQGRGAVGIGELQVGLVDDHQRAVGQRRRQPCDVGQRHQTAGRVVGRAHEDQLHRVRQARQHGVHVQREGLVQRQALHRRALHARAHRIHAEGRRADGDGIHARPAERAHQQVDGLVAAATDQHLVLAHGVQVGQTARAERPAADPDSGSVHHRDHPMAATATRWR